VSTIPSLPSLLCLSAVLCGCVQDNEFGDAAAVWSSVLNKLNTLSWVAVRARRADVVAAAAAAKASEERRSTIIGGDDAYWQAVAQNNELWEQPQQDEQPQQGTRSGAIHRIP